MQIIEVSATGVRSAVITVQRRATPLRFVLFPMIHLGTPAFYQAVADRLSGCGVIVAEGVGRGSVMTSALTMAYRTPGRSGRLGLVPQRIDLAPLVAAGAEVINPDLTSAQLKAGWRTVPPLHRAAVLAIVPAFAIAFRLFGSRRVLGRYLETEDVPLVDQPLTLTPALEKLIIHDRDEQVSAALGAIAAQRADDQLAVGVVYGAGHVAAIVRGLAAYGFRPRSAEWLTVFDF